MSQWIANLRILLMNRSTLTFLTFLSGLCGIGSAEDLTCLKEDEQAAGRLYAHLQQEAYAALEGRYAATLSRAEEAHFGTEFLAMKLSIKTVGDLDEALDHIHCFSSQHSEAVLAEDPAVIRRFLDEVDAAAVYANTSTAFTDGGQFGMGAEIGISTQKLHARGQNTAMERLHLLVDEGSFLPLNSLYDPYENRENSVGIVSGMAEIVPGIALWAFACLVVFLAWSSTALEPKLVWDRAAELTRR